MVGAEPVQLECTTVRKLSENQVANMNQQSRHPGIKRRLYFVRSVDPSVSTESELLIDLQSTSGDSPDTSSTKSGAGEPNNSNRFSYLNFLMNANF